jgi:hypothetical protein
MQFIPFQNVSQSPLRKFAFDDASEDTHRDFILAIFGVEMWGRMIVPIHGNNDSKKSADDWHRQQPMFPYRQRREATDRQRMVIRSADGAARSVRAIRPSYAAKGGGNISR